MCLKQIIRARNTRVAAAETGFTAHIVNLIRHVNLHSCEVTSCERKKVGSCNKCMQHIKPVI